MVARMIAQKAGDQAGQPFIVDNRGGAAGNIGADNVAKSPGDGYTILQTVNVLSLSPALYRKLQFDPVKDLTTVTQLTASPLIIVANAKTSIRSRCRISSTVPRQNRAPLTLALAVLAIRST